MFNECFYVCKFDENITFQLKFLFYKTVHSFKRFVGVRVGVALCCVRSSGICTPNLTA